MAKDYYEILGVPRDASPDEIKKRYRELVMKYHPDLHKNDPEAAKRMAEINEAYEVLSNPEKRAQYDRFGSVGAQGAPGGSAGFDFSDFGFGGGGDFFDLDEILRNFGFGGFGGARRATYESREETNRPTRGEDIEVPLTITLKEAVLGTKKDITITRKEVCPTCKGTGVEPGAGYMTCPTCKGSGVIRKVQRSIFGEFVVQSTCPTCHGTGRVPKAKCHTCGGTGIVTETKTVEVKIPAGVDTGTRVRVKGQGNAGLHGGPRGDLYVRIKVAEDPVFRREGDKLYYTAHITFPDAVLGTTVQIPLIEGGYETLRIPPGTQNGMEFRIPGRGAYIIGSRRRGDLIVKIQVDIPTNPSQEEVLLIEKLKEIYDSKKNNRV
jgi:molecular chaperone DnaJ